MLIPHQNTRSTSGSIQLVWWRELLVRVRLCFGTSRKCHDSCSAGQRVTHDEAPGQKPSSQASAQKMELSKVALCNARGLLTMLCRRSLEALSWPYVQCYLLTCHSCCVKSVQLVIFVQGGTDFRYLLQTCRKTR